jgi:hypothetical protein
MDTFSPHFRFLLVALQMDSLAVKISRKAIKQALTTLPEKIDDMYDEAMARIRSQSAYDDLPDLANGIL